MKTNTPIKPYDIELMTGHKKLKNELFDTTFNLTETINGREFIDELCRKIDEQYTIIKKLTKRNKYI